MDYGDPTDPAWGWVKDTGASGDTGATVAAGHDSVAHSDQSAGRHRRVAGRQSDATGQSNMGGGAVRATAAVGLRTDTGDPSIGQAAGGRPDGSSTALARGAAALARGAARSKQWYRRKDVIAGVAIMGMLFRRGSIASN